MKANNLASLLLAASSAVTSLDISSAQHPIASESEINLGREVFHFSRAVAAPGTPTTDTGHFGWYIESLIPNAPKLHLKEIVSSEFLTNLNEDVHADRFPSMRVTTLPFDSCRDVKVFNNGYVLLGGAKYGLPSTKSTIVGLFDYSQGIQIDATHDYSFEIDAITAIRSSQESTPFGGEILVFDGSNQEILSAHWDGPSSSLPDEAAFGSIANASNFPPLSSPNDFEIHVENDVISAIDLRSMEMAWNLTRDLNTGSWIPKSVPIPAGDSNLLIRHNFRATNLAPVQVRGNGAFSIYDESNTIVFQGSSNPASWSSIDISSPILAAPGDLFTVKKTSNNHKFNAFRATGRYGSKASTSKVGLHNEYLLLERLVPGSPQNMFITEQAITQTSNLRGLLAVRLFPSQGAPDLAQFAGDAALRWSAATSFEFPVSRLNGMLSVPIKIDASVDCHKVRCAVQLWIMDEDGNVAHSRVVTSHIASNGSPTGATSSVAATVFGQAFTFDLAPSTATSGKSFSEISTLATTLMN